MFQFEYLNKTKMISLSHLIELFEAFRPGLAKEFQYCIEIRNPNFLKDRNFDFPTDQILGHMFLQGYYMPSIFEVYENVGKKVVSPV
jgi:hypothetical protein